MQHRSLITACALAFTALSPAGLSAQLAPTPDTGTGPFYPADDRAQADADLTRVEGRDGRPEGDLLEIVGTVRGTDGSPVAGAELVIWQTDSAGFYDHPRHQRVDDDGQPVPRDPNFQYWGRTTSDADGRYRFLTIVPRSYRVGGVWRPHHVHFRIRHPEYRALATEMQFTGDPAAEGDFVTDEAEQERLAVDLVEAGTDGGRAVRRGTFDIVLAGG